MAALMYRNGPVNLNYKKEVDLSPHSCNISIFTTPMVPLCTEPLPPLQLVNLLNQHNL